MTRRITPNAAPTMMSSCVVLSSDVEEEEDVSSGAVVVVEEEVEDAGSCVGAMREPRTTFPSRSKRREPRSTSCSTRSTEAASVMSTCAMMAVASLTVRTFRYPTTENGAARRVVMSCCWNASRAVCEAELPGSAVLAPAWPGVSLAAASELVVVVVVVDAKVTVTVTMSARLMSSHWRSVVGVGTRASYVPVAHSVSGVQARSLDNVGGVLSYSFSGVQSWRGLHAAVHDDSGL